MTKAMPFLQKVILLSYDPRPLGEGAFFAAIDQRSRYQRKVSFRWESSQLSGYMLFCQSRG